MHKSKLRAAVLGGSADEIEGAFYEALQRGDVEALMACWADDDEVFCVHPGGPRLIGPAAIRTAFEQMFANGPIRVFPTHMRKVEALASSVHNVLERVELQTDEGARHAFVLATNVYHKTTQGWRMVAHHASPGMAPEGGEAHGLPAQRLH